MQNEPTLPLRCWDSKFVALPGSGAQPRGFGPGQVFPYMPVVSLVRSPSCRRTSPGLRPGDDDLECEPSPAPPISSSFPFSPPVPVGRMFHRHLPHQCPRDARPICGAWIAGGPWAGWSTSSTAEVTVGLASPPARPQLLPLSLSLSVLHLLAIALLCPVASQPRFTGQTSLTFCSWGEAGGRCRGCLGVGVKLGTTLSSVSISGS